MTSLLLIGDIHLGRTPWRLGGSAIDVRRIGPAEAWRRCISYALDKKVDAVILAGDVVDQDRDRFEAYGQLEQGIKRLVEAGAQVLGVAGNHDHIALPRLADRIKGFHLLGAGGRWERVEIGDVDILGWSFPGRHYPDDPLLSPGLDNALDGRRGDAAVLGVLHADLDAAGGGYAPTTTRGLMDKPVDRWFLGHIHRPSALHTSNSPGYLGSLVGLDRGEQGFHGPWLATVHGPGNILLAQHPQGPVHWLTVDVDVTGLSLADAAEDELHQAMEMAFRKRVSAEPSLSDPNIEVIGCTVRWSGRCSNRRPLARFHENVDIEARTFHLDDQVWTAVAFEDASRPAFDLTALAEEGTPVGMVAQLLLRLESEGEAAVPEAVHRQITAMRPLDWVPDAGASPPPDMVMLKHDAALRTLDMLLGQRAAQGGI